MRQQSLNKPEQLGNKKMGDIKYALIILSISCWMQYSHSKVTFQNVASHYMWYMALNECIGVVSDVEFIVLYGASEVVCFVCSQRSLTYVILQWTLCKPHNKIHGQNIIMSVHVRENFLLNRLYSAISNIVNDIMQCTYLSVFCVEYSHGAISIPSMKSVW